VHTKNGKDDHVKTIKRARAVLNVAEVRPNRGFLALEIDTSKGPPKEFPIFAAGLVKTTKGDFKFTERSQKSVLAASAEWGNHHSMDWEHRALFAAFSGDGRAPAACWYGIGVKEGSLFALNAEWTKQGSDDLVSKSYRYISPAFDYDLDTREILELVNCSLTNLPATKSMNPLLASALAGGNQRSTGDVTMDLKKLIAMLGLHADATEAEVLAAMMRNKEFRTAALSSAGKTSDGEALAALSEARASNERVAKLSAELEAVRVSSAKAETDALIAKAVEDTVLEPGSDLAKMLANKPAAEVKVWLSSMPKQFGKKLKEKAEDATGHAGEYKLSGEQELALARLSRESGLDKDKIRKTWIDNATEQLATKKHAAQSDLA
jgi:phage I-like protein